MLKRTQHFKLIIRGNPVDPCKDFAEFFLRLAHAGNRLFGNAEFPM